MKFSKVILLVSAMLFVSFSCMAAESALPQIGAQVFIEPGQTQQQVSAWFDALEKAGMTVCRIRIHESHVNRDGKWDFSLYDYAFDQAEKHGIRVFATLFPNDSKKSVGGEKFPESDRHFKEIATYIDKTVAHYKDHPALLYWVIQNEPGVGGVLPDNEFTDKAYQKWLGGYKAPASAYVTNDYSKEQFLLEYETWYLQWLSDRIRKTDPKHGLHVNNHQIFHNVAEYDFVSWRKFLTTLGASAHPSWHYGYFTRPQYVLAMAANCNVIKSGAGELLYWVTELQAGNNLYSGTVPICPTGDEITQWLWTSAACGAEGVIFWSLNPRSATGEPGEWSLLALDGGPSERYDAAREFISTAKANAGILKNACSYDTPVTVLYNRESLWAEKKMQHGGVRQDEGRSTGAVMKETLGLYQACAENGIIPAFSELREFDWTKDDYRGQMMIIANQVALPDEYAPKIAAFVEHGGKLLVTGLTGFWGTQNVCHACNDFLFKDLFGASFKDVEYVGDDFSISLHNPSATLPSHMWKSTLNLSGAKAAALDEKGGCIACSNIYGDGEVLWIPELVGIGKRRNADLSLAGLLQKETAGLDIPVRFKNPVKDVVMTTMRQGRNFLTVIVNKNAETRSISLDVAQGLTPKLIYASKGGNVPAGNTVSIKPEETLVVKWTSPSVTTINVLDFGKVEDVYANAVPYLQKALAMADGCKNPVICFPKGTYHFSPEFEGISDRTYSPNIIRNINNLTIDGCGSEFIFHGKTICFDAAGCENLTMKNFRFDWDRPMVNQAEFVSVGEDVCRIRIDKKQYPYHIEDGVVWFDGEGWTSREFRLNDLFDKESRDIVPHAHDLAANMFHHGKAREIEEGLIELEGPFTWDLKPEPGNIVTIYSYIYPSDAFHIVNSKNVLLKDIVLHHGGSMAVFAAAVDGLTIDNFDVVERRSKDRYFANMADGFHIKGCRGKVIVRNCDFNGGGDDFFNVHNMYLKVLEVLDSKHVKVQSYKGFYFAPGDSAWFVSQKDGQRSEINVVKSIDYKGGDPWPGATYVMEFEKKVPSDLTAMDGVENASWCPEVEVCNNRVFKRHRATGVRVTTPCKADIHDNWFNTAGHAILIEGDMKFWWESGGNNDLTIRNNVFDNCMTSGSTTGGRWEWGEAVIDITPSFTPQTLDSPGYHKNVVIRDNVFHMFDYPILRARSIENLQFISNKVVVSDKYEPYTVLKYNFLLEGCRGVKISGNEFPEKMPGHNAATYMMKDSDLHIDEDQHITVTPDAESVVKQFEW